MKHPSPHQSPPLVTRRLRVGNALLTRQHASQGLSQSLCDASPGDRGATNAATVTQPLANPSAVAGVAGAVAGSPFAGARKGLCPHTMRTDDGQLTANCGGSLSTPREPSRMSGVCPAGHRTSMVLGRCCQHAASTTPALRTQSNAAEHAADETQTEPTGLSAGNRMGFSNTPENGTLKDTQKRDASSIASGMLCACYASARTGLHWYWS